MSTNGANLSSTPHEIVTIAIKQTANKFNAVGRELLHGVPAGPALCKSFLGLEHFRLRHVSSLALDNRINRFRCKMTTRAKTAAAEEVAAIEELMGDLEKRLRRLSGSAKREASGASDDIGEFVSDALDRIMGRVRESAAGVSQSVTDEAKRFSGDAFRKLTDEVENRPLLMLGIAAGIGFLAGLANRR